jgi:hypothetical protein
MEYRSRWKQRKDARKKNATDFLNNKQTPGAKFITKNGIKINKQGWFWEDDWQKWQPTETVQDEWIQRVYSKGNKGLGLMSKRGPYEYGYVPPPEPVKKKSD